MKRELNRLLDKLYEIIPEERVLLNESMSEHTTFRIGGPAKYFISPANEKEISSLLDLSGEEGIPYYIIGNGSNILVSDNGIDGLVISIGENMSALSLNGDIITAGAGARLSKTAAFALNNSLTGFEHLAGIPGTVGGAVYMNAGAYGTEIADVCESVRFLENGEIKELSGKDLNFAYRKSVFSDINAVILSARFKLKKGDYDEIKNEMELTSAKRRAKQPLEYPSAGSAFKRPDGYFAARLIEDCGLKGVSVGGAEVSEKHSGFIINKGGATAADIKELIGKVRAEVEKKTGVLLEPEIRFIGD